MADTYSTAEELMQAASNTESFRYARKRLLEWNEKYNPYHNPDLWEKK